MEVYGDYEVCFPNGFGSSSSSYQRTPSNSNGLYSNGPAVGFDSESTERFMVDVDLYNKMCNMSVREEPSSNGGFFHGDSSSVGGGGSSNSNSNLYNKTEDHCGSCKGVNVNGILHSGPALEDDSVMYNRLLGFWRGQGISDPPPMVPFFGQGGSISPLVEPQQKKFEGTNVPYYFNDFQSPSIGFAPYANRSGICSMNSSQNMFLGPYTNRVKKGDMNIDALPYQNGKRPNSSSSISTKRSNSFHQRKNLENWVSRNQMLGKSPESAFFCNAPWASPSSVAEVQGYIFPMAKDQNGCRYLQRVFEEGTRREVQIIFDEIIDNIVELMMNQFGNYLVQKLLDVCTEEQRMKIVLILTRDQEQIIRTCLDTHGTRVVQKLILTIKTKEQIASVISAFEPGFLDLINDLNGNHVIKRCLECFSTEDNKFIYDGASKYCVEIATHRHGCCVLQHCVAHSSGKQRDKLVAEFSSHAFILSQDPFGNYVVQYVIDMKIPCAVTNLMAQFEGNFVHLSAQKFSSHVVEKCLKDIEESRPIIVQEMLSVPHFEQLLQDPYANYVIHSAINYTKGHLRASLVGAIVRHGFLRTSPYCKKIFSHKLLKN